MRTYMYTIYIHIYIYTIHIYIYAISYADVYVYMCLYKCYIHVYICIYRRARLKIDVLQMMIEQKRLQTDGVASRFYSVMSDASPQGGTDWLRTSYIYYLGPSLGPLFGALVRIHLQIYLRICLQKHFQIYLQGLGLLLGPSLGLCPDIYLHFLSIILLRIKANPPPRGVDGWPPWARALQVSTFALSRPGPGILWAPLGFFVGPP